MSIARTTGPGDGYTVPVGSRVVPLSSSIPPFVSGPAATRVPSGLIATWKPDRSRTWLAREAKLPPATENRVTTDPADGVPAAKRTSLCAGSANSLAHDGISPEAG